MKQPRLSLRGEVVSLPCACANLRRAARIVTQRYDQYLQPAGIKTTQFTLLQALRRAGNISQGNLGDLLGLDSTTLTRTLALLRRKGWIQTKPGEDRREVRLTLTAKGKRKYLSAVPYWRSAQRQLQKVLGEAGWKQMMESTIFTARPCTARTLPTIGAVAPLQFVVTDPSPRHYTCPRSKSFVK